MSFDFEEAFVSGAAETGGTFRRASENVAWIGTPGRHLMLGWETKGGRFHFFAGSPTEPVLEFACATDGWEEWQAIDAGRDFARRAYEIAGRLGK